jgi:hypothetical protein
MVCLPAHAELELRLNFEDPLNPVQDSSGKNRDVVLVEEGGAFLEEITWLEDETHGGTLLFPFFSLYITQKFGVGMTQAGIVLGSFSAFGLVGSMVGGALTDKFGRKSLILFGLVFSAISTLSLGLVSGAFPAPTSPATKRTVPCP